MCPGYADASDIIFRDMNQYAEKKVRLRTKERDQAALGTPSSVSLVTTGLGLQNPSPGKLDHPTTAHLLLNAGNILPPISTDWQEVAIPRFFADYILQSDVVKWGSFGFLRDILSTETSQTYLGNALRAVALMSLANQTQQEWLAVEAKKGYGQAILGVAKDLQTMPTANTDALLASTFLFGFFEVMTYFPDLRYSDGSIDTLILA